MADATSSLVGDRYRLLEQLGRGGMGTVWRAVDELLLRQVAVKHVALPPELDDRDREAARARVIREAQAAARLSHPATVTVFDVVEDDGNVHIVMELVEAPSLAEQVARSGPMEVDRAARLGLALAAALDAAHRKEIVHRDVKPSNVMLLPSGAVKLADFGIASVKDHPSLTRTGQVIGSPSYMAPEQALGQPATPATDWWGLGATLYFALEGRPPFDRPGALPTLTAVVDEEPAPATRAGPLAPALTRLLAKEPSERPTARDLEGLLAPHTDPDRAGNEAEGQARSVLATALGRPPAAPPAASPPPPPSPPPLPSTPPDPPPAPARQPAPPVPPSTTTPRGLALVAAAIALLVVAALVARSGDGGGGGTQTPATPTTTASAPAVPAGWVTYTDPKVGYRVAHPAGWKVERLDATRTDITDPATGSYLRLDWTATPGPSPEGAWSSLSRSFGSRHDAYQEIRIEPTTYKGFDAALWEYAYSSGGARLHAANLGLVTATHGFALNFQTPEDRWASSQPLFETFKASFEVPR